MGAREIQGKKLRLTDQLPLRRELIEVLRLPLPLPLRREKRLATDGSGVVQVSNVKMKELGSIEKKDTSQFAGNS